MSRSNWAAAIGVLLSLGVPPLHAAETINGRWAVDPSSCWRTGERPEQTPFVVTSYAVRWLGENCRVGRMYKTGETVHIQAFCWGAQGERSIPVSLRSHGGRLQFTWNRDAHGDMSRCN